MAAVVLEIWRAERMSADPFTIYPDGCRDVIWYALPGEAPRWRLTALDLTSRLLVGVTGASMQGFRLRPGAMVSPDLLCGALRQDTPEDAEAAIAALSVVPDNLAEVLAVCAALPAGGVEGLARRLGVSARTVQRLVVDATAQGPLYWLRLARLRAALQSGQAGEPLAQAAAGAGFADQAHFSREARAFHGESPARLLNNPRAMAAILAPGFGAVEPG